LEPNLLVTGGASGISVITEYLSEKCLPFVIPLWFTNLLVNIPLLIWAKFVLGSSFVKKSLLGTVLLSLFLKLTQQMPQLIYYDDFINSVFGGAIMGVGIGFVLKGGATTGGSDLLATLINKKNSSLTVSALIFVIDVVVILGGMFVFGASKAMYSVISVYITTQAINLILEGLNFARAVFIMSDKYDAVANMLIGQLHRGATILYGCGAYSGEKKNVIVIVVARKQISRVKSIVGEVDKGAFVFITDVREVMGAF
jgi:uncharacterized membrane-anchored protein YitT (DUF2179 family)